MDFRDVLRIILKRIRVILIFTAVAVIAMSLYAFVIKPPVYTATAIVYMLGTDHQANSSVDTHDVAYVEMMMESYLLLAQNSAVQQKARGLLAEQGITVYQIEVTSQTKAHVLRVSGKADTPKAAADAANTYALCAVGFLKEQTSAQDVQISVLEQADAQHASYGLGTAVRNVLVAGICGFAAGVVVVLLIEIVRDPEQKQNHKKRKKQGSDSIRDIKAEQLLERESIRLDTSNIAAYLKGKVVLVTGAGGSIGSELCLQVAKLAPDCLIMLDIYENGLYELQNDLRMLYPALRVEAVIGSVRDMARMQSVFAKYRPQVVYHAAAHKHVPLMEESPGESVKNNIFGTLNTVQIAHETGVERFVMISTDKAVKPLSVMGACKRVCEMILQYYRTFSPTQFVAVRFGNVLGSCGSVVPLFLRQIEMGGPVTVTHPDVTRYFMTAKEAVSLVLQAGANAQSGGILILDMAEPVRIRDVADRLIRLAGYEPDRDIRVVYTGLRPGEKLTEELYDDAQETLEPTECEKIHRIAKEIALPEDFMQRIEALRAAVSEEKDFDEHLRALVPTYRKEGQT